MLGVVALGAARWLRCARTPTGFLPQMDEGAFVIDFFLPPAPRSRRPIGSCAGSTRARDATPEVATFTRRTGTEIGPATATQQNRGDIMVRLAPRGERRRASTR